MVESGKNIGGHRNDDEYIRRDAENMAKSTRYSSAICRCRVNQNARNYPKNGFFEVKNGFFESLRKPCIYSCCHLMKNIYISIIFNLRNQEKTRGFDDNINKLFEVGLGDVIRKEYKGYR